MIYYLHRAQTLHGDPSAIWEFFATPRNLSAITPANLRLEMIGELPPRMYAGQMIEYRFGLLPGLTMRWLTEITHYREGEYFVDEQRHGPYSLWHHEHQFAPGADGRSVIMTDKVTYSVGWGLFGSILHALWIRRQLATIFDHRAARIGELFPRQT